MRDWNSLKPNNLALGHNPAYSDNRVFRPILEDEGGRFYLHGAGLSPQDPSLCENLNRPAGAVRKEIGVSETTNLIK